MREAVDAREYLDGLVIAALAGMLAAPAAWAEGEAAFATLDFEWHDAARARAARQLYVCDTAALSTPWAVRMGFAPGDRRRGCF